MARMQQQQQQAPYAMPMQIWAASAPMPPPQPPMPPHSSSDRRRRRRRRRGGGVGGGAADSGVAGADAGSGGGGAAAAARADAGADGPVRTVLPGAARVAAGTAAAAGVAAAAARRRARRPAVGAPPRRSPPGGGVSSLANAPASQLARGGGVPGDSRRSSDPTPPDSALSAPSTWRMKTQSKKPKVEHDALDRRRLRRPRQVVAPGQRRAVRADRARAPAAPPRPPRPAAAAAARAARRAEVSFYATPTVARPSGRRPLFGALELVGRIRAVGRRPRLASTAARRWRGDPRSVVPCGADLTTPRVTGRPAPPVPRRRRIRACASLYAQHNCTHTPSSGTFTAPAAGRSAAASIRAARAGATARAGCAGCAGTRCELSPRLRRRRDGASAAPKSAAACRQAARVSRRQPDAPVIQPTDLVAPRHRLQPRALLPKGRVLLSQLPTTN